MVRFIAWEADKKAIKRVHSRHCGRGKSFGKPDIWAEALQREPGDVFVCEHICLKNDTDFAPKYEFKQAIKEIIEKK